jgi:hypothetical protein
VIGQSSFKSSNISSLSSPLLSAMQYNENGARHQPFDKMAGEKGQLGVAHT